MNIEAFIEAAKTLGVIIPLIVAVVGIWKTLAVVRVKIEAETRLKHSAEIESHIKLLDLFTRLMDLAHARSGYHFSEEIAKYIANSDVTEKNFSKAIVSFPVGAACQDAAIAAIAQLASKHTILKNPALQGLESIKSFKPGIAEKYIEKIKNS
ncbi:hypothetical protein N7319_19930 [Aeromonas dhakensis]|uniref:hypothetical protein n=1 Tax=Aeromonas dhakensis TaxID=196024 RepID=UPI0024477889|nr:hypothetical protein [Aeromonas dhakensis]MDH0177468.1 hypothetical protein [Aeromonas dhakensis]